MLKPEKITSILGKFGFKVISQKGSHIKLRKINETLNEFYECNIMHPPLTDTKSSMPLPIPREFKSSPKKWKKVL